MKFRKKPVVIEAVQWGGANYAEISLFTNKAFRKQSDGALEFDTPEGRMKASVGDWIIKGVKGEFYPCKPDIFMATYEPVRESDT